MDVTEAIKSVDMEAVIDKLNAYAYSQLKTVGVKSFNGKEPIDFVGEVLLKVIDGQRDWTVAKCSFTEFLFGCLKSEIFNFFKTNKYIIADELPEISSNEELDNFSAEKNYFSELLEREGADVEELLVFDYWMDGINKPAEIAEDLGIDVKDVYRITKRLERRLPKIQKLVTTIL